MSEPQTVAASLAARLAKINIDSVSGRARQMTRTALIDTVAVTLAGAAEPAVAILARTLQVASNTGAAQIFGHPLRGSILDAALINGTAAHAIDYDDMAEAMGGHPSVPVVPVLFALGEQLGASGRQIVEAYIVGFEAECRLGRVVMPHHYESGWHPTATLGVFGATAAAARLLQLDEQHMATALAIAASSASGVKANFGTMTKPLHVGQSARGGLLAALLAQGGFTAKPTAFENKEGFFAAFDGLANVHLEELDCQDPELEIEKDAIGLKQFPACGSTHPAILAMFDLVRNHGLKPEDVAAIEIVAHRRRLPHTNNPDPQTPLAAKFSIQYATARALVDNAVRLGHFEGTAFLEPEIKRLLQLITTRAFPDDGSGGRAQEFAAEVTVTTRSGNTLKGRAESALGRGFQDPMTSEELWEKFRDCSSGVVPLKRAEQVYAALENIESCANVAEIGLLTATSDTPG